MSFKVHLDPVISGYIITELTVLWNIQQLKTKACPCVAEPTRHETAVPWHPPVYKEITPLQPSSCIQYVPSVIKADITVH